MVPASSSSLVGRATELARVHHLLARARLVTVTGIAGVGKTRLAIEAASIIAGEGEMSVAFVDVAVLERAEQVLPALARAVGVQDGGAADIPATVRQQLEGIPTLVVPDNAEHLLAAVGQVVAQLLAACPTVRFLVTSRAPLQLPGEYLLPLDPLPVPDLTPLPPLTQLAAVPAVALLVERVRASLPDFTVTEANSRLLAEISVVLEGLPLAVELAAPQVRALGLDEVLARSHDRYQLLHRPRRPDGDRHRSLATVIDASLRLLTPPARTVFARLAVFAGGWTLPACEDVCGDQAASALAELVDHSLVQADHTGTAVRYRMLETLRGRAAAELNSLGTSASVHRDHALWAAQLAQTLGATFEATGQGQWLDRADVEHANLLAAIDTCLADRTAGLNDPDLGLRIAVGLSWLWQLRGHVGTGRALLTRLLDRTWTDPRLRARGFRAVADLAVAQADYGAGWTALSAALALFEQAGDLSAAAEARATAAGWQALSGELDKARTGASEVLNDPAASPHALRVAAFALATVRWSQGRDEDFRELVQRCLNSTDGPANAWRHGRLTAYVGLLALAEGDHHLATIVLTEGLTLLSSVGDYYGQADCLFGFACLWNGHDDIRVIQACDLARRLWLRSGAARQSYFQWLALPVEASARHVLGPRAADHAAASARTLTAPDLLDAFRATMATTTPADPASQRTTSPIPAQSSTPRERQVAALVATGMTNGQIGRRLGISDRTVERHLENLKTKLGFGNRAQVAAWIARTPRPD